MSPILVIVSFSVTASALLLLLIFAAVRLFRPAAARRKLNVLMWLGVAYLALACLIAMVTYGVKWRLGLMERRMAIGSDMLVIESDRLMREVLSQPKHQDPRRLNRYEAKVYSQFGEDGIIAEIFRRIGTTNRYFVEFGAEDGMENNTVALLRQGWTGLWMDGDTKCIARARQHFAPEIEKGRLRAEGAFVTAENIQELFAANGVPAEFDLLSIDIDYNDYHVWKAIESYKPRVVVIEYNGIFPPGVQWVADYKPDAVWDGTTKFGASLSALEHLGREKGYALVGCGLAGINAFFVRTDLLHDKFCAPFTAENHHEPPRYWMRWGGHARRP